ncbi:hypothetical protein F5Y08DRAFT_350873 [Xylaria arbuscula]|nr:hypothetical protein F5Y08DRAFT_350873 [Xylaria arbuscula]
MKSSGTTARALLRVLTVALGINSIPNTKVRGLSVFEGGSGLDPWYEPEGDFDTLLANNTNITGEYAIPGYNISVPYGSISPPDYGKIDGWSWSIAVAANIPLENSTTAQNNDSFHTGGKIVLNAPKSLVGDGGNLTVEDGWRICVFAWEVQNDDSYPKALRKDNGTCGSILSDKCIENLKQAALPALGGDGRPSCSCPDIDILLACGDNDRATSAFGHSCYARPFSAADLRTSELWEDGQLEIYKFGETTTHGRGNRTAYDDISSLAWPVMMYMGTGGTHVDISLACVRATDPVNGTTEPDSAGSVNSRGSSLTMARMMAILACVAVM